MIKLFDLAEYVQNLLNSEVKKEKYKFLNTERETYEFNVVLDTGNYKNAIVDGNNVTNYINCIISPIGSVVEGTEKISATINTMLEICVKIFSFSEEPLEIANSIREVLDSVMIYNSTGIMRDDLDNVYTYGINYSLANSGTREQRPKIGDSFTFRAYINWYLIESGINSSNVSFTIDGYPVFFTNFSQTRSAQMDSFVKSSENENRTADNVDNASALAIIFFIPMRSDNVSQFINDYLDTGNNPVRTVVKTIAYPNGDIVSKQWQMKFSEDVLNGEMTKNALLQITMTVCTE